MRTIPEIDAAATAFATTIVDKAEARIGFQFQDELRKMVLDAITTGYHQGVIDERNELLKGGGK